MQTAIATAVMNFTPLAMAIVDIDHFKVINDRYGHPTGDQALIAVAHALKTHCGEQNTLARIGGEEFAIAFPGADLAQATFQCEHLRATIEGLPHDFQLTGSIGITVLRIGDELSSLYARADKALYVAKHGGRNRVASIA